MSVINAAASDIVSGTEAGTSTSETPKPRREGRCAVTTVFSVSHCASMARHLVPDERC
jgi:hypothetical protein